MATAETTRKTPHMMTLVKHWRTSSELPDAHFRIIGLGEPSCFRCGWLPPVPDTSGYGPVSPPCEFATWPDSRRLAYTWRLAGRFLDRAHLVDWVDTHDDTPANVVPLCHYPCHVRMPEFREGQRVNALAWVQEHPRLAPWWQFFTDAAAERGVLTGRREMKRLYVRCLELTATAERRDDE